ncbi:MULTISPECIES: response regulator transcription factor [unclassified Undibacterium]|uniref:response regulator transcription factor n=1 Tax=unclassified Undibacterium TaxID=2630295 RepID=UPI002AC900FC|nr:MULTISPECIES: LuxR C-terminal-related transcriptional regulator [unclassified Undibacterium]MEB0140908.1 LuxR C-terminal-related transcriptional regulator [Undibacterium sp. CCC2.1]MEB0173884.1 LuxR C-terminal-related transcriptional regulator [Undibacterium sp. CCC1.1]MEB0176597.1 LuxR C-terminal-related transcriptional regulator [Undibacterium sp. CCC3.4]MEB0217067.1 LuxR C-terminal-related transcriptional regulator [Undibacterium sp. 5I2]WPX44575.1 LuxR C-terminal-related transcriptional
MSSLNKPVHISSELASGVFQICRPFFKQYGLNGFSYSRIYSDGARTELWSNALAFEHAFYKETYLVGADTPSYVSATERFAIVEITVNEYPKFWRAQCKQQLGDLRELFNHDHAFMLINKEHEYHEYIIYYAPVFAVSALNFCINNLNALEHFADSFKLKAVELIQAADRHRLSLPCMHFFEDEGEQLVRSKLPVCSTTSILTLREREVAKLLLIGKVAREIACLLHISPRTVESHIKHIKVKTNCSNKSELISFLYQL